MANLIPLYRLFRQCIIKRPFTRQYSDDMILIFAAGNHTFYDETTEVRQVDLGSTRGDFGILAKHVSTLSVLKPGVISVYEKSGNIRRIFVSSGIMTVNDDSSVQIIAEEASPVENLDPAEVKDVLSQAQQQFKSAVTVQAKGEAAIALEVGEALEKAIKDFSHAT